MTESQRRSIQELTWPSQYNGAVASTIDTVLSINGVRVIIYPNGKLDILMVANESYARAAEQVIREKYGKKILGHRRTVYAP